jgi:hypothetical protein
MVDQNPPHRVPPTTPNLEADRRPSRRGLDPSLGQVPTGLGSAIAARPRRASGPAVRAIFVALLLAGGVAGLALIVPGNDSSSAAAASAGSGPAVFTPASAAACNSPSYTSASSLLITLPNPVGTLASGGTLSVIYEFSVNASKVNATGMNVTLPSVFATFPLTSGSKQLDLSATVVKVPTSGWATALSMDKTVTVTSATAFKAGASATLSTQKLAVMVPTNYTKLTLQFRWSWSFTQPNGTMGQSAWSVPTPTDHLPAQLRSIFYPAPYVSFLNSSGPTATIGLNYTATIGGAVAGKYFLLEMEFPGTGKVVQAQGQTAGATATTFTVFIPMLSYTDSLSPGAYLVHIHDACGALLYNKTVQAVFAPNAAVHIDVTPLGCDAKFDGSSWGNGSIANVVPSIVAYSISVGCSGHSFKSWSGTGGVHINNGTSLLVSASGTFSVVYA